VRQLPLNDIMGTKTQKSPQPEGQGENGSQGPPGDSL